MSQQMNSTDLINSLIADLRDEIVNAYDTAKAADADGMNFDYISKYGVAFRMTIDVTNNRASFMDENFNTVFHSTAADAAALLFELLY